MTTTKAEFFRSLKVALRDLPSVIGDDRIVVEETGRRIEMLLSPLPPRRLSGQLVLQRWQLTMEFSGYSEDARKDFLIRFDRAFQRGGG